MADLQAIDRAMQHMGDQINNMDAVEEGDLEIVSPGFEAIARLLAVPPPMPVSTEGLTAKPTSLITTCQASRDGDCSHAQCPQLRENEPHKSGRHCPLDNREDE